LIAVAFDVAEEIAVAKYTRFAFFNINIIGKEIKFKCGKITLGLVYILFLLVMFNLHNIFVQFRISVEKHRFVLGFVHF